MTDPSTPDRATLREQAHRERRRRWLIGGAVVVVVAAIVVGVVVVAGGSDDSSSSKPTASSGGSATSGAALTTVAPTTNGAKPLAGGVCSGDQLAGTQVSSGLSGSNQVAVFAFSNQSKTRCTVNGAAAVTLLDASGKKVPSSTTTGGGAVPTNLTPQDVSIDPGAQASLVLTWVPIGSGCSQVRTIEFTMPESKGAVKVDTQFNACNSGALNISPMQPGVVSG